MKPFTHVHFRNELRFVAEILVLMAQIVKKLKQQKKIWNFELRTQKRHENYEDFKGLLEYISAIISHTHRIRFYLSCETDVFSLPLCWKVNFLI